ncbi:glycosyltransferase family 2 protein [Flavobacterium sp. XN-5]|uniref:glycosyltransferase family 2 protein n=1 Tax=Flavobacterium sp. XN-5 TaxID=2599390 RepID=UPI0013EF095F|nr:glycosyltransferase family A protein [Flavobacterium sp. XN-5]NGY37423.1 glycosyltransferase family 2 protein [Flavobacterium sp. XN-5]
MNHSENYKISVIIPCYNAETTIEKCISSVLEQTHKVEEIILVDDGSSDNSVQRVRVLMRNCSTKITIIEQVNSGPSVARNKGVLESCGNWIAFLDSDDYWVSNKIEIQISALKNNFDIVLLGGGNFSNKRLKHISFDDLIKRNYFQTSASIVKREVIFNNLFNTKQKYSEDYRVWLEIAYKYKVAVLNQSLAFPVSGKMAFGVSGLSSRLWLMQKGEMSNYTFLYKRNKISLYRYFNATMFSFFKYLRRRLIVVLNK